MDARRRRKRNERCPLQEIFLFLFVLGLAVIKDVGGFMVSTLCKRPWSCPSQEAKEVCQRKAIYFTFSQCKTFTCDH
jgi:hypothetical protein